jgi:hypothetical protein
MADHGEQAGAAEAPDSQTRAQQIEDQLAAQMGDAESSPETDQTKEAPEEAADPEAKAEGETPDGLEEVEFEGDTFQVPKKIKEGLLREADYRRKTQDIAKQRQILDNQLTGLNQQRLESQFMEAVKEPVTQFHKLSAQLDQYENLDWRSLSSEDMLRARVEMDRLERERSKVAQSIEGQRGNFVKQQEQLRSELLQKGDEIIRSRISGWNDSLAKEVADYALSEGYPTEEVKAIVDPRYVLTLWKAQQYDKLQANKGKAVRTAQQAPKVVKPGASRQMPSDVKANFAFKKALKGAQSSSEKARLIEDKFAATFGRGR